ncbi:translational GTPase TypA [Anaerofustis butyriciformans]|uniref:translational GTPase TypA n=1 Tax=Anaerofustis butyriciformans TaxID=3108533 RepID=UPI003F8C3278
MKKENIRNIAIIAHVDHGKTTLIDAMLKQSGTFRENEDVNERVMDSNDLERERGITILAKNTSVYYDDIKINIVDTPGHADFGGEVERSLSLVNGVILLADAFEGCMPQTRFVLKKALEQNLPVIIVINKVDRENSTPEKIADDVLELFIDLEADESYLDSKVLFASAKQGWASETPVKKDDSLEVLFKAIKENIPCPTGDEEKPFQFLVSNIEYDEYTGRLAIGKIERGHVQANDMVSIARKEGNVTKGKISQLYTYEGLKKVPCQKASAGEIVCIAGIADINIGETIGAVDNVEAVPFVEIDKPVLSMNFSVNTSPLAGMDGKYVTSRHLRNRLFRELLSNISLEVKPTESADTYKVSGRGELHLSILIENMRREGYEFMVSKPTVITKEIDGVLCEPFERLVVDVDDEYTGTVIESCATRKGELLNMDKSSDKYTRLEFMIPSRGLIGYRSELMTATKGTAVVNSNFEKYMPYKGDLEGRSRGSLIASEPGESITYGLYNAQERGTLFIGPNTTVYEGMVVGENSRPDDMTVNVCKRKQVTNMRAAGSDEALRLTPHRQLSLEQYLEFINDDELLEVTPNHLRVRKEILDKQLRIKAENRKRQQQKMGN